MQAFIKVMKALTDPNGVKILKLLQEKEMCVCEIQSALDISQPNASKHLKLLEDSGLVESRKDGLWVNYSLTNGMSSPYAASILGNLRHWLNDDPQVSALIKKVPLLNRKELCKR
jgi:ArsR family transcriptional regulator